MRYRNLSQNHFSGKVDALYMFHQRANLELLDISSNDFTGPLPDLGRFGSMTEL